MSNKANAVRYGGGVGGGGGGQQGGTSLMDIISGSTPKQLQKSQQEHETSFQEMMNKHEQDVLNLQKNLASQLAKEQAVIDLAKQNGVTPDDFANQLSAKITQNKLQELQNQNDANNPSKNPNIGGANQIGANSKAAMSGGLPPQAIVPPTVPQGAVGGYATVPGLGVNSVQGSRVNQDVTIGGGFPSTDPKTGVTSMVGQTMLPTTRNISGGIFPGPIPITPGMKASVDNTNTPPTMPPANNDWQGGTGVIPQNTPPQSSMGGGIPSMQYQPNQNNQFQSSSNALENFARMFYQQKEAERQRALNPDVPTTPYGSGRPF